MSSSVTVRMGEEYAPGDVLFHEGEHGEVMYVVQAGSVRISKRVAGQDKVLALLGPGEFFGEMAILNGKPRTATATVVERARCLVIDPRTLEDMVTKNSEIALRLIKKLARRLDSADTLIEVLLHRDPRARVLMALSRYAETFGEELPPGSLPASRRPEPRSGPASEEPPPFLEPEVAGVCVRASLREIASEVGVDAKLADDMMTRVGRLGIAYEDEGKIIVTDVSRLRDFVEFLEVPKPTEAASPPAPGGAVEEGS